MYQRGGEKVYQQGGTDARRLPAVEASVKVERLPEVEIDGWWLAEAGGGVGSSPEVPGMHSRA
jgi:hypothetical protein